jgi:hypothetical protein
MNAMTRLARLTRLGTSVWLDALVPPAGLERLVREDSVTGVTSNPTIFRAAVLGDERYAQRIAALGTGGAGRARRRSRGRRGPRRRPPSCSTRASRASRPRWKS